MSHTHMQVSGARPGVAPWLMPPNLLMPEPDPPALKDIPVADLGIRCLRGAGEIAEIVQLRGEINLAAAAAADPQFTCREKKETNWAWYLLSSCMVKS